MLQSMQDLITRDALARATRLSASNPIVSFISTAAKIPRINEIYRRSWSSDSGQFLELVFQELGVGIDLSQRELENIPESGPFIVVANHPFGAIDGLALLKTIRQRRPDFKIMANFLLQHVQPLKDAFFSVNPFEELRASHSNMSGIKDCLVHLRQGGGLGIFPAGEVSTYDKQENAVVDRPWSNGAIKLIQKAGVPVVPVHFAGQNSITFHALGLIHPRLRTLALPAELLKKSGSTLTLSIGRAIHPNELNGFEETEHAGSYLRSRTYAVGYRKAVARPAVYGMHETAPMHEIITPTATTDLIAELQVNNAARIACHGSFEVYELEKSLAPRILREVGRLREITFRSVGEGTGLPTDLDEFDEYYKHLVVWDAACNRIVGAYRIGHGPTIMKHRGLAGFYLSTLYRIEGPARDMLSHSAELGRSFVVQDYQRHRLSLFTLWKGIEAYLSKHKDLLHLVGPVSISSNYHVSSKRLMMNFFRRQAAQHPLRRYIKPLTPYHERCAMPAAADLVEGMQGDIKVLDRVIADNESSGLGVPVLIKKYMAQNGSILTFNCDPNFNNSLDGFLIVNIADIPTDMRECLRQ
jgi:putative hemolysin